jgi:hypothetical protein
VTAVRRWAEDCLRDDIPDLDPAEHRAVVDARISDADKRLIWGDDAAAAGNT